MRILFLLLTFLLGLSTVARADCTTTVSSDGSSVTVECTDGSFSGDFTIGG